MTKLKRSLDADSLYDPIGTTKKHDETRIWSFRIIDECINVFRLFYFYLLDYITHRTLVLENQKKIKKIKKIQVSENVNRM